MFDYATTISMLIERSWFDETIKITTNADYYPIHSTVLGRCTFRETHDTTLCADRITTRPFLLAQIALARRKRCWRLKESVGDSCGE